MSSVVDSAKTMVAKVAKSLKQKSLTDLIRAIRAVKPGNESNVITQALSEIKVELKDPDRGVKTIAVSKLIYLQVRPPPPFLTPTLTLTSPSSDDRL